MSNIEHYDEAVALVRKEKRCTILMLEQEFKIGYRKANALVDAMAFHKVIEVLSNGHRRVL